MDCHKCGARLPYGTYGQVKCEFCNEPNYVSIPGEKEGVAEKVGPKKEPTKQEEIQKPEVHEEPIEEKKPETPIKTTASVVEKKVSPTKKSLKKPILIGLMIIILAVSGFVVYSNMTKASPTTSIPREAIERNDIERVIRKAVSALDDGDWSTVEYLYDNKDYYAKRNIPFHKENVGERGELVRLVELEIEKIEGPYQYTMEDGVTRTAYEVHLKGTAEYTSNLNPEIKDTYTQFDQCHVSDHDGHLKVSTGCFTVITKNKLIGMT